MCGIFGYVGNKLNAGEIVISGLKSLEYRGYDSWGFAQIKENGTLVIQKKTGKIKDSKIIPDTGSIAIGHTRWATHGGVTEKNAHPHLDCRGTFALIHNGIIENYAEIKKGLKNKKHRFISETDTEVAVHLIEEIYNQLKSNGYHIDEREILSEAVRIAFKQFAGLNAVIVLHRETGTFVAAKNGSPLVVGCGKSENFIASDAHAILPYTRSVCFMDDNEMVTVSKEKIFLRSIISGKEIVPHYKMLDWQIDIASKGKFPHYMLKEIFDQQKILDQVAKSDRKLLMPIVNIIRNSHGTYLVGCGTAAYACLAGTYIFSKIAGKHINYSVGSEFEYLLDYLTEKSFVLALSQSGETIDVIEAVKKARGKGAKIGTMVNVLGSTLYRIADAVLLLNAGVEKAVVCTKAFTTKLAFMIRLAGILSEKESEVTKDLITASKETENLFKNDNLERIRSVARKIKNKDHIYVIGRGLSYPIALETALKIKEASYVHAEGFAAGELKHGVIALIEKGTPCIAFLPNDETYGANLAGAMEMKARGGSIIGISYKPHEIFDYYLPVADCGIASLIPSAIVGQLIGYYLSVLKGYDPDMPRNLAKSVTVK